MTLRCHDCRAEATTHVTFVRRRRAASFRHLCTQHARVLYVAILQEDRTGEGEASVTPEGVLFDLEVMMVSELQDQQLALLREVGGSRFVPARCGLFEAAAIERALREEDAPRPLTHDAWIGTVLALGGQLEDVVISDLRSDVLHARLRLRQWKQTYEVDVRPSDALPLALLADVPIRVSERVLRRLR